MILLAALRRRLRLVFFFSLIGLICGGQAPLPSRDSAISEFDRIDIANEHIVIFPFHDLVGVLEQQLFERLETHDGWEVVSRSSPALGDSNSKLTDFLLVRFADEALLQLLRESVDVRVVPQQKIMQRDDASPSSSPSDVQPPTDSAQSYSPRARRLFEFDNQDDVPHLLGAEKLWELGFTGQGIQVAVFDTGVAELPSHFRNIVARWDFTDEGNADDVLGHGTFIAGVIASQSDDCPGFAPDAAIHSYRVFTSRRVSYTSWFLDALNHAIFSGIDVLNLSIGGPDFLDKPFVDKVMEASANDIIVVSAIGNDGPIFGTLNNPADQPDVIGVGGITFDHKIAPFSSRGMTTWELPQGYGRVKPDLVAFGESVSGTHLSGGCRTLSGTSVSSPVVAGAVALLASTLPNRKILNPGSMKQALIEAAERLDSTNGGGNIFEQGFGQLNLLDSFEILQNYVPRASLVPAALDFTDCPYMWPFCSQPLFASAMPIIFNVTILNGMGVSGRVSSPPKWNPGLNGDRLLINTDTSPVLWPYSGQLGLRISVRDSASSFSGIAEGVISLTVESPSQSGGEPLRTDLVLPIRARIVPTPARKNRILWDQYHSLRYPSGYFPRDALWVNNQPFDLNGDHIHTNFRDLFNHLVDTGYFIDVLGEPFTCFDASDYGTLMVVDSEEEFFAEEIAKLYDDVTQKGLSLVVLADWYNTDLMEHVKFYDENTRQWWVPATGGANVPALNDLLKPFGIALGDRVYDGEFSVNSKPVSYSSGNAIVQFPRGGRLLPAFLTDQVYEIVNEGSRPKAQEVPVLGFLPDAGKGRIVLYGDSNLVDSAHSRRSSLWLAKSIMQFASTGTLSADIREQLTHLDVDYSQAGAQTPVRLPPPQSTLHLFSKVLGQHLPVCSAYDWQAGVPPPNAQPFPFPERRMLARDHAHSNNPKVVFPDRFSPSTTQASTVNAFIFCIILVLVFLVILGVNRRASSTRITSPDRPEP